MLNVLYNIAKPAYVVFCNDDLPPIVGVMSMQSFFIE